jgi:hypothetical protein
VFISPTISSIKKGPVVLGIPKELYTQPKGIEGLEASDYRKRSPKEPSGYYIY